MVVSYQPVETRKKKKERAKKEKEKKGGVMTLVYVQPTPPLTNSCKYLEPSVALLTL